MTTLPNFPLLELLHESQHSRVYRSVDGDNGKVIVKTHSRSMDAPLVSRLYHELETAQHIESDFVVPLIGIQNVPGGIGLISKDTDGQVLRGSMPSEGMSLPQFLPLARDLARGLCDIHNHQVVHKDINPNNIILTAEGRPQFIDFGIASRLTQEYQEANNPNQLEGTLIYISPEQTGRMNRPVDYRTDFYSLGITFFEMLTGTLPFTTDDPLELVHCHIAAAPRKVNELREDIPAVLSDLVDRLLAKEASARYQSAEGLLHDIQRLCQQSEANLEMGNFQLGRNDHNSSFHISARLYGRETELNALLSAFERVVDGAKELFLVSGYSGIGKSALVAEIHKPVTARKAFCIQGKFDQITGNVAYTAVIDALAQLVENILSENNDVVQYWSNRLLDHLGDSASLMINLIPSLAHIIGDQGEAPVLGPLESRTRFQMVFRNFISAFANEKHPLVLFLDDLQWSDSATLDLIELLLSDKKISHCLLLGAYRQNEVNDKHRLYISLEKFSSKALPVNRIQLHPLSLDCIQQLMADTLHTTMDHVKPLAELVQKKTNGNPFFTYELLKDLHRQKLLYFNATHNCWSWNDEAIAQIEISENVVTFMVQRLKELPNSTQHTLRLAACIGNIFDLKTLAELCNSSPKRVLSYLWEALRKGIIQPCHSSIRKGHSKTQGYNGDFLYRFQHDRVQQAAYELVRIKERACVHLDISRALIRTKNREEQIAHAVDIVRHLQYATDLITQEDERVLALDLCRHAAKKAISSVAYPQALSYVESALDLSLLQDFETHYDLIKELHFLGAEAAYLCGQLEQAEDFCKTMLQRARTPLEQAQILEMQLVHCTTMKKVPMAIEKGLEGLACLGLKFARTPNMPTVLRELAAVRLSLTGVNIQSIADRPVINDEELRTTLNLLMQLALPVYYAGEKQLYANIILKRVKLALKHGISSESANAFLTYGLLLGGMMGDYSRANEFGKLALILDERYGKLSLRTRLLFVYALCIHSWNHHWSTLSEYLKRSIEAGCRSGDLIFLSLACALVHHFDPTMTLETGLKEGEKYLVFLDQVHYSGLEIQAKMFHQLRRCLMGRTNSRLSLSDAHFDEAACLKHLQETESTSFLGLFHILKLELAFTFGAYKEALELIPQCEKTLSALLGFPAVVEFHFYNFLTRAAIFQRSSEADQRQHRKAMKESLSRMRRWAHHCPVNFQHRHLLMEAEQARLQEKPWPALNLYRRALQAATDNQYIKHIPLIHELSGYCMIEQGQPEQAGAFLREAEQGYQHYGAVAKQSQLRERHMRLLNLVLFDESPPSGHQQEITSTSFTANQGQGRTLDLNTVIKSSMAMSSVIDYEKLLAKMMRIIIESAGAQRGVLIIHRKGQLVVETQATLDEGNDEDHSPKNTPIDSCKILSSKIVRYVFRTHKTVVLGKASTEGLFSKDPYLLRGDIKSILSTTIRNKDRITGVLYLENNLVEHAFTEDRVELLQLLIMQAAISMENARLYTESKANEKAVRDLNEELEVLNEDLERLVTERTQELTNIQEELVDKARSAGMAEIASSVLHNVGNLLNSVITSCQLIQSTASHSKLNGLLKANALLRDNIEDLDHFIRQDPKGVNLLKYYLGMDKHVHREQTLMSDNLLRLTEKVESIRNVIMAQQSYASSGFQDEELDLLSVVDDAINILESTLARRQIQIIREYNTIPPMKLPKNKLIHLLVNLIKNAAEAMESTMQDRRQLKIIARLENTWLVLAIQDQGHGIKDEDLRQLFQHGFTTKSRGHGFGLHSCANAMSEMNGTIEAHSDGIGHGATFTLKLPLQGEMNAVDSP